MTKISGSRANRWEPVFSTAHQSQQAVISRPTLARLVLLTLLASCSGPDRVVDPPSLAISDGANGGNAHFYFLPPLVPRPSPAGVFDPTLEPFVRISANGSPLMDLPATLSAADEHYHVNWHTNGAGLDPRTTYRLTVRAEGVVLGFADVIVLPNGKGLKNINTGEYVGLVDGRTLPIKFRIEEGAIPEGALVWSFVSGGATSSPARGPDGSIYAGSVDRRIYALAPDGTVRWSYVFPSPVFATPTIGVDGTIYTASDDAYFYALNPDGTLRWRFLLGTGMRSSAALASDGTIYIGAGRFLWALNPDGTLRWRYPTGGNNASPAVGADGTVYAGAWDRYVYAINSNGTLKWRYLTGGTVFLSSPALGGDGAVYVGSEDWYVYALNADGTLRWRYFTNAGVFSSPALGADGTVYVGSADGWLYAIQSDGSLRWRFQTGGEVFSSPAVGADGTVYVGSEDRYLYALNPDGTLKWRQLTAGAIFSHPALGADGPLFVAAGNAVYAFRVADGGLATTPWPKFHHDSHNSGNVLTPLP